MSEARARARLQRSLGALTIGVARERERRDAELYPLGDGDMMQQVHLDVAGVATAAPATSEVVVAFINPFVGHLRDEVPTFAPGTELLSGGPVMIDAQVKDWIESDEGLVTGARIRVAAHWPGAYEEQQFKARLHLTFLGHATPTTDDSEG